MLKQFDTVRVRPGFPERDIPTGSLATILEVYTDPRLAYEIEVVDANGLTLYVGVVNPSWIELVEPGYGRDDRWQHSRLSAVVLLKLLRSMLVLEGSERSLAVDALTDHVPALSSPEGAAFAQVLVWLVAGEADAEAVESELHALAELAEAGLVDETVLHQLGSVGGRARLTGSALEHFDYLITVLESARDREASQ